MKNLFILLFSIALLFGCSNSNEPSDNNVFPYKNGQIIKKIILVEKLADYDGNTKTIYDTSYNVTVKINENKLEFIDFDNNFILMSNLEFNINSNLLSIKLPENSLNISNITKNYELIYNSQLYEGQSYYFLFKWDNKKGFSEIIDETYYNNNKNISYCKNHYYFYY